MVDDSIVVYAATVAVGGPAIARRPSLEEVAVPADATDDASSVYICSSAVRLRLFCSFGVCGIEVGQLPRPDRVAEAIGITSKRATRIGRARSRRPGCPTTLTAGPILFIDIEILLLGHSGREKRRRPCQGGAIICPIVDIIGEASLRTIGLPDCQQ